MKFGVEVIVGADRSKTNRSGEEGETGGGLQQKDRTLRSRETAGSMSSPLLGEGRLAFGSICHQ